MRVALDTNVLAYAEGVNGPERRQAALQVVRELVGDEVILPIQVVAELFTVLTRKARWPAAQARAAARQWIDSYTVFDTTAAVLADAMELAVAHHLASWDAVILAAAAQAECRLLLSEDMQDGFVWRGVTVRNPFPKKSG
ncbi:PIN domain-containing protein [Roseomonas gilardii]|uniref:PIN domain-containing protein n=1 Tax=Roseomonas gilardii TaxID=257708 RepID=A0A1L7AMC7_9PROT|nr:PIN domain-containing protein [Roseomonas gilardii]APT59864.1 twitching motility protein PilT [Roseomonas gilardii]MDT8332911.1 PIN domain-containing protein [Roseomonas gilardii]